MKRLNYVLIVLFVILQYQLWLGDSSVSRWWQTKQHISQQRLENQRLKHRNRILEAEVVELQNGLETIEEHARFELGMIKRGEVFYQIPSP
ncbi:cell division protein FtsB [Zooshikella marina]|uniref:cell division protein FtsB n=1 Tax=Zooshikella ganghwensis TaxID=202772 RepID=UPI00041875C5|nr:cell division protein FtsB [Zooshikella ganghwensis]MBU2705799.1 cell division protein FtsB [Zooshikella ganghwensis]